MNKPLVIVGASARAAAQSAARAGYNPLAVDLFGDVDLQRICPTVRVDAYPAGVEPVFSTLPDAPWLYTGAWENHADRVDRLAAGRELLGNPGKVLRQIRDPFVLAQVLQDAGLPCPLVARIDAADQQVADAVKSPGAWLCKPIHSAGGTNISVWQSTSRPVDYHACYLQQRIEGVGSSGVFLADGTHALFLGATEQLVGVPWTGAGPFGYAGTIGPLSLSMAHRAGYRAIGELLVARFGLRGLFGVDCVLNDRGVWPIEVNPRYTASVEVLERALGIHTIEWHVASCRGQSLPDKANSNRPLTGLLCGKAVLYTGQPLVIPEQAVERMLTANRGQEWPVYADIPMAASRIEANWPICTVLASGKNREEVMYALRTLASQARQLLDDHRGG